MEVIRYLGNTNTKHIKHQPKAHYFLLASYFLDWMEGETLDRNTDIQSYIQNRHT